MSFIKTKSLEEFYFQGGKSYQYGGEVPVILFPDPPAPSPSPTPTITRTPTNTPTNTLTSTPTNTPTKTPTNSPTKTPTNTPTKTPTNTPTMTLTPSSTTPAIDPDAQSYINAVQGGGDTLTLTEQTAVNQLVIDLKAASIWTFWEAFYPFLGGTSTSTKWNLVNPVSGSTGRSIVWVGSWIYSSVGITNTGGIGYTNVGSGLNNGRVIGVYINGLLPPVSSAEFDLSEYFPAPIKNNCISLASGNTSTKVVNFGGNSVSYKTTTSGSYQKCMLLGQNSITSNMSELWQNTTQLINVAQNYQDAGGGYSIGGSYDGINPLNTTDRTYGTAFLGKNQTTILTPTQITDLYNAVYNFNNTLGRA
jgi:hypothetical protein